MYNSFKKYRLLVAVDPRVSYVNFITDLLIDTDRDLVDTPTAYICINLQK